MVYYLAFLSLSNMYFVSFFVLVRTKSFTPGLFHYLPTLTGISCCFCCALVLVGAFIRLPFTSLNLFLYVMNHQVLWHQQYIMLYLHPQLYEFPF
jgi:hypothetical protein